jgi:O-acetylhomoserine (thiol)-lyase
VVHSLTKWLGGHGTGIGGIVVDSGKFDWKSDKFPLMNEPDSSYGGVRWAHDLGDLAPLAYILRMRVIPLRNLGACISPDNAWMAMQGIETLPLRMERHCENSLAVAKHLQNHPSVEWVRYPGLEGDSNYQKAQKYLGGKGGSMVVFGIKGGAAAGSKFIEALQLFSHLANVGDAKSLAIHPATTTHSQMTEEQQIAGGIPPEMVRLSVGIEHIDDITADLNHALTAAS